MYESLPQKLTVFQEGTRPRCFNPMPCLVDNLSLNVLTQSSSSISIPQLLSIVASLGHISFSPIVAVSYKNSRVGLLAICFMCFHE